MTAATIAPPTATGGVVPDRVPCPDWCTTPAHREPGWDADASLAYGFTECAQTLGSVPANEIEQRSSDLEVGVVRSQSYESTTSPDQRPSTAVSVHSPIVSLGYMTGLTPADARRLARLLTIAADRAETTVTR